MASPLALYLAGRPDAATFLIPSSVEATVEEIFGRNDLLLPRPYRIYPADETQPPALGFPIAECSLLKELEVKLDRWLTEEVAWQVQRQPVARDKAQAAFASYTAQLMKAAENALVSNLLTDYHAIFWLAHSGDVARHFSSIPRRVSGIDTTAGRAQGDVIKYRIFARWASDTREQMSQVASRLASVLDGDEQRGLQFFRLLQEDVLIFTEEFIGPDLRELRSFLNGYLRRDFQAFRDTFERLRIACSDLLSDRTFRAALPLFGASPDQPIGAALLLDGRFQSFLFETASVQNAITREDREQFQLVARRVREFAILSQLRRAIVWMTITPDGQIVSTDRRNGTAYSRSTRPLDFGRPGVVDPMIHRFGLIYDISAFSQTLGDIRRGGRKEEVSAYRQMLLFQRKLEIIAERQNLQFEKFLGDGAFYTTRRAIRLVRAAIEIQRFYAETKRRGFAFNKGLRIALNYGYYRLLPMRISTTSTERITEFYGPGIVELSRLTTGKATKEIDDLAAFLVAHGYDPAAVHQFFAPLARGVDVVDHSQQAREFHSYINANGHLINEGIVAPMSLLQELSSELLLEEQPMYRLQAPWGTYVGFAPAIPGIEFAGVRLLGMVSLKGLDNIEVGEIVPFVHGEVEAMPFDPADSLVTLLRQEFHNHFDESLTPQSLIDASTTAERLLEPELVVCIRAEPRDDEDVVIAEWDPQSDDLVRPLRMPRGDFQRLFSFRGEVTMEMLANRKDIVRELYNRLCDRVPAPAVPFGDYRDAYETFVLGPTVEKL